MSHVTTKIATAFALSASLFALPALAEVSTEALGKVVTAPSRDSENSARDKYRRPVETLTFLGVRPDATVVEIAPGGGYWTEILAPYLREKGHYLPAVANYNDGVKKFTEKFGSKPELYGKFPIATMDVPKSLEFAPAGSADVVLTFRNVHNWMKAGHAEEVFAAFAKALKPGGILGVEEHRADPTKPQDPKAENGYVREDYVIELATKAGFKLVAKSDVNANSKDTKDYADGVWTLPPTLKLGDKDKSKYLAIGESDRMLLKFQRN